MKGTDLKKFFFLLILSIILGFFIFSNFEAYSDLITFLSITIGFEITSLSIIFGSSLKKKLYDNYNKDYGTELHRLRSYYRFSIYFEIFSILLVFIIPDFEYKICSKLAISKSIIVLPILSSSFYCLIKTCNDLFRIFVFPTND